MRILFLGDIVGRSGRDAVVAQMPGLRARLDLDFVVVNGENAAGGYGITPKICEELFAAGVDCITTGNHVWDQKELIPFAEQDARVLRPINFTAGTPGRGATILPARGNRRVLVMNCILRLFMEPSNDPFAAIDHVLAARRLGHDADAIIVDMHGEATSEKQAMGWHLDGRVSLVVGTHTHVPTADLRVLPGGTAYQTDAGMCGDYTSVIGMEREAATLRFLKRVPVERLTPALGETTLSGLVLETDPRTGLARHVEPLRLGGTLTRAEPVSAMAAATSATA